MADEIESIESIEESNDIVEELNDISNDTNDTQEENIEDIFNPDILEFEESHELEGYDLSKYKDVLDIDSKEVQAKAKKFKELGFSQDQIDFYLEDVMQPQEEVAEPTAKEIRDRLAKSLTSVEKRNYNAVNTFVKQGLEGTELEAYGIEAMKNPHLVKMFNALYSKVNNAGTKVDTPVTKREVKKNSATVESVFDGYKNWMQTVEPENRTPENRVKFLNDMIKGQANEDELTKALGNLLKV